MTEVIIKTVKYLAEIEAIKAIRIQVFQIEQGISEELEFDGLDETAIHLLAYLENKPVGTTRIRKIAQKTAKIERLSVLTLARRKGIAKKLMTKAIEVVTNQNYDTIVVYSQNYIKGFYQKLDFKQVGNIFEEANIPHVKMIKKI